MEDLETFDAMAGALAARGLVTPQDVATERAALVAQLNGDEPPVPAGPAGPSAAALGLPGQPQPQQQPAALAAGQDQPGQVEPDPLWQGPTSPGAYDFGVAPPRPEGNPAALQAQALEQERAFRTLFHQEGIPLGIGNEIGRKWNAACARGPVTEVQLEQSRQDCHVALTRMWGSDFAANLRIAQGEVARLAKVNPAIPMMLEASGLGNDAWLANALVNLARAKGRAV